MKKLGDLKVENLQSTFNKLRDDSIATQIKLKEIDLRGAFESDDEVGFFFKELKAIQEDINNFLQ